MLSLVVSCDITKQAAKNKTDTDYSQDYEKVEKRDGGNAIFIPQTNTVYKDTIIYVQGTNGTDLKIIYDKQGNLQAADCNGALIDVITKISTNLSEQTKEKESIKTESFDPTPLIWAMAVLGFVVLLVLGVLIWVVNRIKKPTT